MKSRTRNERAILTTLHDQGAISAAMLAKSCELSAQSVSVILRKLTTDGLITKGKPTKGQVGKPSTPISLASDGAFSFGLKIGRQSSVLVLTDFAGTIRATRKLNTQTTDPDVLLRFAATQAQSIVDTLPTTSQSRISGMGIAIPGDLGAWQQDGPKRGIWPQAEFLERLSAALNLQCQIVNDGTAACRAELVFGKGRDHADFAYFHIDTFVGGGIVCGGQLMEGHSGNAGAFGSLPYQDGQLLDAVSSNIQTPDWTDQTSDALAHAITAVCAVFDFPNIVVDGTLPQHLRHSLVSETRRKLQSKDFRGLIRPEIYEGSFGETAQALGASAGPLLHSFFRG